MTMMLGGVEFTQFECPPNITFGGRQAMSIHDLPGGGRIVDVIGPVNSNIAWSGILSGNGAATRARLLDSMRAAGTAVTLQWDVFSYSVIVAKLSFEFRNSWWIPYSISCVVVSVTTAPGFLPAASLSAAIAADLNIAAGYITTNPVASLVFPALANPGAQNDPPIMMAAATLNQQLESQSVISGAVLDAPTSTLSACLQASQSQVNNVLGLGYLNRAVINQIR